MTLYGRWEPRYDSTVPRASRHPGGICTTLYPAKETNNKNEKNNTQKANHKGTKRKENIS